MMPHQLTLKSKGTSRVKITWPVPLFAYIVLRMLLYYLMLGPPKPPLIEGPPKPPGC